jgi:uncharacterized protein YbaR (Trm112 family)
MVRSGVSRRVRFAADIPRRSHYLARTLDVPRDALKPRIAYPQRMKRDLMEILCCPVCKGDLELKVDVERDEIVEGSLFCKNCNHRYEIKDGIPDLLPPDFK